MSWKNTGKNPALPTIVSVGALDEDFFYITLSNGHSILLGLAGLIDEPAFAALIEHKLFDKPKTDGMRLYWVDGPSLYFDKIMEMTVS